MQRIVARFVQEQPLIIGPVLNQWLEPTREVLDMVSINRRSDFPLISDRPLDR